MANYGSLILIDQAPTDYQTRPTKISKTRPTVRPRGVVCLAGLLTTLAAAALWPLEMKKKKRPGKWSRVLSHIVELKSDRYYLYRMAMEMIYAAKE